MFYSPCIFFSYCSLRVVEERDEDISTEEAFTAELLENIGEVFL